MHSREYVNKFEEIRMYRVWICVHLIFIIVLFFFKYIIKINVLTAVFIVSIVPIIFLFIKLIMCIRIKQNIKSCIAMYIEHLEESNEKKIVREIENVISKNAKLSLKQKIQLEKIIDITEKIIIDLNSEKIKDIVDEYLCQEYNKKYVFGDIRMCQQDIIYKVCLCNDKKLLCKKDYFIGNEKKENLITKIELLCCICGKDIEDENDLIEIELNTRYSMSQQYIFGHRKCIEKIFYKDVEIV